MMTAPRNSLLRRMGSLLALMVLCLLTTLSSTRCKYGPDKVTGLDRSKRSASGRCIQQCAEQYQDSVKAENKLHKQNIKACGGGGDDGDDDGDDSYTGPDVATGGNGGGEGGGDPACIAAENDRHRAALQRIAAGRRDCIESCHHQGGGSGR